MKRLTQERISEAVEKMFSLLDAHVRSGKLIEKEFRIGDIEIVSYGVGTDEQYVYLEYDEKLFLEIQPISEVNRPDTKVNILPINDFFFLAVYKPIDTKYHRNWARFLGYASAKSSSLQEMFWRPDELIPEDYYA